MVLPDFLTLTYQSGKPNPTIKNKVILCNMWTFGNFPAIHW